ncbi:imm11 family protein [Aeromonas hydrophila]|uniref:imm11 family protein n=1 Tax=Aeromonas hydrophila TaxID=644 RepID=UPI00111B5FCF|nr:DUF1629 domain-containing protein [Aeromonas hydrophila]MBW3799065.1 hypothetical protein [Aeromonas hydrophila]MBW3804195.1 hypothetical protein [Aeromonas hydrophila]MBW3821997.1 hypothetical protein [Aeromonas hydrophila]MCX4106648.1 hypothetical protein [Aeromonas hydrophila]TNJ15434.1 hypothetical protein CF112_23130 [Aeromonas hydrophila]
MFYEVDSFYYRDVNFKFSERNDISYSEVLNGQVVDSSLLFYEVDVIDDMLNKYDILPTIGPSLVSQRFVDALAGLKGTNVKFLPTIITDSNGKVEHRFYALFILDSYECVDVRRSDISYKKFGPKTFMVIDRLIIDKERVSGAKIFSLKEKNGYIIINDEVREALIGLNGIDLIPVCD